MDTTIQESVIEALAAVLYSETEMRDIPWERAGDDARTIMRERAGRELARRRVATLADREACAQIAEACSGGDAEVTKRDLIASRIRALK